MRSAQGTTKNFVIPAPEQGSERLSEAEQSDGSIIKDMVLTKCMGKRGLQNRAAAPRGVEFLNSSFPPKLIKSKPPGSHL